LITVVRCVADVVSATLAIAKLASLTEGGEKIGYRRLSKAALLI
jgi:hypothetical protein